MLAHDFLTEFFILLTSTHRMDCYFGGNSDSLLVAPWANEQR